MKKSILTYITLVSTLVLAACGSGESQESADQSSEGETQSEARTDLLIGSTTGPFEDMLNEAIVPIMEENGYTVQVDTFSDYVQPNIALTSGDLDANLFQNKSFLDNYNEENQDNLVGLLPVPTPPMGIYSDSQGSTEDIEEGMVVSLPNDPVNMGRGFLVMEDAGWIELVDDFVPTQASEDDIESNPYNIELTPLEAAQTPRSLPDVDFSVITGNFALDAGFEFSQALFLEDMELDFMNYLTVRNEDQDAQFAEDLQKAFESDEFQEYKDTELQGFSTPPYMEDNNE